MAALALCGAAAAPAGATDVSLEGEALTLAGAGGVQADARASGAATMRISGNGAASGVVTVPQSTTHVFLRLRGSGCFGSPRVSLAIDGVDRLAIEARWSGYAEPGARLSIPAGSHTVSVAVDNGSFSGSPFCSRTVWIDGVTIVGQPFSPTGWRNARLSKRAPVAKNSGTLVGELRRQIRSRPRGALIGTTTYSSPFYVVGRDQPRVRVIGDPGGGRAFQTQLDSVPLPADARPAFGTDAQLSVWQPSTDTMWEFWGLRRDGAGNWRARAGGRIQRLSRNPGHFGDPPGTRFGATATAIPLLAGTQRIEELRRGVIEHAVDFAVLRTGARAGWCWPAQRTDRGLTNRSSNAIPGGTRFRLPPRFDLEGYARRHGLSRYALTVARAVQRYGMVARETSVEVGFFAEDPTPIGWNPYGEIFEGLSPDGQGVLRNFPWKRLQVVAPPRGGCADRSD